MTYGYGEFNRVKHGPQNLETIAKALVLGINFFDTAWMYQSYGDDGDQNTTNEELLGKAIAIHGRDKFVIATKFGVLPDQTPNISNKEIVIRSQLNDSLARLGVKYIDLYYAHRVDPTVPIEETMHVLNALVREGKIRYVGLSECTPAELRRAHAVHPVSAIQMEWSLHTRSVEGEVVSTARELGVGIVAYSPIDRGLLSGTITSADALPEVDWRKKAPRFLPENLPANLPTAEFVALAERKKLSPAQLALAWVHAQGEDVFPIPGTKNPQHLEENAQAVFVELTADEMRAVEKSLPPVKGDRYPDMEGTCAFETRL